MSAEAQKLKALQLTLDRMDKTYGKGTVMKLGDEAAGRRVRGGALVELRGRRRLDEHVTHPLGGGVRLDARDRLEQQLAAVTKGFAGLQQQPFFGGGAEEEEEEEVGDRPELAPYGIVWRTREGSRVLS